MRPAGPSRSAATCLVLLATIAASCDHDHQSGHEHAEPPPAENAVQNEMRLLHAAMLESVTAIANDDLGAIPPALHRVHEARAATEAALESGRYRPPRDADHVEDFVRLDEAFHAELERLVLAARANDSERTAQQLGAVLSRCSGCHSRFRPEVAPAPPRSDEHPHAH